MSDVSAPSPAEPHPHLTKAQNVVVVDGRISWSNKDRVEEVAINQIIFALDKSRSPDGSYIVCGLKETPDNADAPFQLVLAAVDTLPEQLQDHVLTEYPAHLRQGNGNAVDAIVSTKSGLGLAQKFWQAVLQPLWALAQQELDPPSQQQSVIFTKDAQSVKLFAKQLQDNRGPSGSPVQSKTVILLSGDGGVVDMLNGGEQLGSAGPSPVLALLPLGTGNALFHSLHKPVASDSGPSPLVLGLRTLFQGVPAALPIFRASFSAGSRIVSFTDEHGTPAGQAQGDLQVSKRETSISHLYGAIVASYGFHASIVYESDTPEYRKHGDKRFGMVAQELLRESHPYAAKVQTRLPGSSQLETDPRDTHAYVLVTPLSNLERTFTISPASQALDGKLRLVHFGPIGPERTMEVMVKAYDSGKHVGVAWEDGEKVRYEEVEELKVLTLEEDERWRKVCIDGTIVEIPKGGELSVSMVENGPFRVLVDSRVAK